MPGILSPFLENLVYSLVLFLVFFVALAAAFAQGRVLRLAHGFARVVLSVLYSPFVYLRRAVQGVCRFSERGEADYVGSEQYLLGKFFLTAQAAVVVLALAGAAAGCVAAWTAFLPPKEAREEVRNTRKGLREKRRELEAATRKHRDGEREWAARRETEMRRARMPHEEVIRRSAGEKAAAEAELTLDPPAAAHVNRLRGFVAKEGPQSSEYAIGGMRRRMDQSLFAIPIQPSSITVLQRWNEAWEREAQAELRMRTLDEEQVRSEVQPDWKRTEAEKESLTTAVRDLEGYLKRAEAQASFRFGAGLVALLVSFGSLLAYLWVAGIVLESAALAVRVADDVRKIREGREGGATGTGASQARELGDASRDD